MALFFFNDTATTEIYTLSLHDALPIFGDRNLDLARRLGRPGGHLHPATLRRVFDGIVDQVGEDLAQLAERSEEHTSELQSRQYLVCRLLLEKNKQSTLAHSEVRRTNVL